MSRNFSIVAAKQLGLSGYLIAVEPQPKLADLIYKSLEENARCSFDVSKIACGNYNGESDFYVPERWSGMASLFQSFSGMEDLKKIIVDVRRFDDVFDWNEYPGNIFLKLDIEGGEYAFLQGAQKMLKTKKPKILLEINYRSAQATDTALMSMLDLLKEIGYRYFFELDDLDNAMPLEKLALNTDKYRNIVVSPEMG